MEYYIINMFTNIYCVSNVIFGIANQHNIST